MGADRKRWKEIRQAPVADRFSKSHVRGRGTAPVPEGFHPRRVAVGPDDFGC